MECTEILELIALYIGIWQDGWIPFRYEILAVQLTCKVSQCLRLLSVYVLT